MLISVTTFSKILAPDCLQSLVPLRAPLNDVTTSRDDEVHELLEYFLRLRLRDSGPDNCHPC